MRKLPAVALAGAAAFALGGTAIAASPKAPAANTHIMSVPLPDGSVARVEYVGNVAPKITVEPRPFASAASPWGMAFPSFAGFDRMMAEMQRQSEQMIRQAQEMAKHPGAVGAQPYIASYGNLPAGETSTTVVSVSNGGSTCTRTTEVVSQGAGKAPKVTSSVTGQCAPAAAPSGGPVDRT